MRRAMTVTRDARFDLFLGGARLADIALDPTISTPCYVYDVAAMAAGARELGAAFDAQPHLVAYAVKANTAGTIVRTFAKLGCGADVVSAGEMEVALRCGVKPE